MLIVPFVYPEPWYLDLTARLLTQEGFGPSRASIRAEDHVEVAKLYPGRLCAATLLHKIERVLERGYREGRPFTGVLIESIHNVAHAYPHIAEAPELWPVLYAMLRSYGATAVSTFTAFDVGAPDPVWEQMLEPSSAARHLSQLLTARADATVFFRQEGHRILFDMPVPGRLQCPPLLAHTWDRQQGRFDGLLSLDDPPDPQVP